MDYIVVTVRAQTGSRDLELPASVPVCELVDKLVDICKLPRTVPPGKPLHYRLITMPARHPLDASQTLAQSHIVTGRILSLLPVDAGTAALSTASGRVFTLDRPGKQLYTIGRSGGGQSPDIDLGQEPHGDTVSRIHAQLYEQGGRWKVVQVTSNNITRVGGATLAANQPHPLQSGAEITIGGVRCTFYVA